MILSDQTWIGSGTWSETLSETWISFFASERARGVSTMNDETISMVSYFHFLGTCPGLRQKVRGRVVAEKKKKMKLLSQQRRRKKKPSCRDHGAFAVSVLERRLGVFLFGFFS